MKTREEIEEKIKVLKMTLDLGDFYADTTGTRNTITALQAILWVLED